MMKYLALILLFSTIEIYAQVTINKGVISENQDSYEIITPNARYIYQITAGGFSSIFDKDGVDWVQFHKTENPSYPQSSASDFRGLPNMVYQGDDGGSGHPGFEKMISEIITPNQIRSTSNSGLWQWTWTFHDTYAVMNIEKIDTARTYWFLYEGPIAGDFSPTTHYWGTDVWGPRTDRPDLINGPEIYDYWQTVYFGDDRTRNVFFVHQKKADNLKDLFTYMGTEQKLGNETDDGMVVFGFGRDRYAKPLLRERHTFVIGFYGIQISSEEDHKLIIEHINNLDQ